MDKKSSKHSLTELARVASVFLLGISVLAVLGYWYINDERGRVLNEAMYLAESGVETDNNRTVIYAIEKLSEASDLLPNKEEAIFIQDMQDFLGEWNSGLANDGIEPRIELVRKHEAGKYGAQINNIIRIVHLNKFKKIFYVKSYEKPSLYLFSLVRRVLPQESYPPSELSKFLWEIDEKYKVLLVSSEMYDFFISKDFAERHGYILIDKDQESMLSSSSGVFKAATSFRAIVGESEILSARYQNKNSGRIVLRERRITDVDVVIEENREVIFRKKYSRKRGYPFADVIQVIESLVDYEVLSSAGYEERREFNGSTFIRLRKPWGDLNAVDPDKSRYAFFKAIDEMVYGNHEDAVSILYRLSRQNDQSLHSIAASKILSGDVYWYFENVISKAK